MIDIIMFIIAFTIVAAFGCWFVGSYSKEKKAMRDEEKKNEEK